MGLIKSQLSLLSTWALFEVKMRFYVIMKFFRPGEKFFGKFVFKILNEISD